MTNPIVEAGVQGGQTQERSPDRIACAGVVGALEIAAGVAVLAGAALQSATGFGFALVSAPLLFAAAEPEEAVALLILLGLIVNGYDARY